MEFRKVLALRGPNVWANFPVLEAWVDLGALKDSPSNELPGFNERLMSWLPSMIEHRCSIGERGGFFERLRRGTYQAHILEHVTLELQSLAGMEAGFGRARETSEDGVYRVAIEYENEEFARACLEAARELCHAAVHDRPYDVHAEIERLRQLADRLRPEPGLAAILEVARERKIPVQQLPEGLIQLGYGARQRRLLAPRNDRTSALSEWIATDQELTRQLLQVAGVPVAEGRPVADAADAWAAAEDLGVPVIVRPRRDLFRPTDHRPLHTREEVQAAYQSVASEGYRYLMVERFIPGRYWRLLVIGEHVVAAESRELAAFPADGHGDDKEQASTSGNGDGRDVTDAVHSEVARQAVEAARAVGLDVAGIDVIAPDVSRPLSSQGGVVIAVCPNPDLGRHVRLSADRGRAIGEAMITHLFPRGETGHIPVVAITGVNGKTTTTRLIAHLVRRTHHGVGMTCTEGIYLDGRRIERGDCSGPKSARSLLQNPKVEIAVFETARGGILREGLGFDYCDVAVMTNIGEGDHLGISGIETPERLAWVKQTIVDTVTPQGAAVLKADDPLVAGMVERCPGSVIFFARDGKHSVVLQHRSAQGRAVFVREGQIILAEGSEETRLASLDRVPLTHGGRIGFQVENVLASVAAAWSLGMPLPEIRAGLESFSGDTAMVPGRFNLLEINGATVILDYGHNVPALRSLLETLAQFPQERRVSVYSAAGDRRDCDMILQGEMLGNAFDHVILYEDQYVRGRNKGEIMALFRQGLARGQRVREIQEVYGALQSIEMALTVVRPGDLLVIQPDEIDTTLDFIQRYLEKTSAGREINLDHALGRAASASHEAAVVIGENHLGKAVYAEKAFAEGELILRGWGPRVPRRTRHSMEVDWDTHVEPVGPLQLINHSCEPNCGLLIHSAAEQMELYALRPIEAGEELTMDYATFEYEILFLNGPCLCGSRQCRGSITGYKDLSPERREAYGPYVAEYLRKKVVVAQ